MRTSTLLTALAVALTLTATPVLAQDRATENTSDQAAKPGKDEPTSGPSGSPLTTGDKEPSAVDPAEATKTGANAAEGASYSRSNDKGDSAMPKQEPEKK
jgi:hypothetical protein